MSASRGDQPHSRVHPATCAAASIGDSVTPSREGFFREVLFAAPTPRTPRYDDYTPGSYHADKLDLARGLPAEAARCGTELRGLLLVGPVGGLWAYHMAAFLSDGDSVRVNSLVMPHARITGKATGRVAPPAVDSLFPARPSSACWSRSTASSPLRSRPTPTRLARPDGDA